MYILDILKEVFHNNNYKKYEHIKFKKSIIYYEKFMLYYDDKYRIEPINNMYYKNNEKNPIVKIINNYYITIFYHKDCIRKDTIYSNNYKKYILYIDNYYQTYIEDNLNNIYFMKKYGYNGNLVEGYYSFSYIRILLTYKNNMIKFGIKSFYNKNEQVKYYIYNYKLIFYN